MSHGYDEELMKYICLAYLEPGRFEGMIEDERHAVLDECSEHVGHLRANGHLVAELLLQPPETALTLLERWQCRDDGRPLCANQGTARRHSSRGSARPQSRDSAYFTIPGP